MSCSYFFSIDSLIITNVFTGDQNLHWGSISCIHFTVMDCYKNWQFLVSL